MVIDPNNPPLPLPGLYRITNLVNGMIYIGQSINLADRIKGFGLKSGSTPPKLKQAFNEFGLTVFKFEPIAYSIDSDTDWLIAAENEMIISMNSFIEGYNYQYSEDWRNKIAESIRKKWLDPDHRNKQMTVRSSFEHKIIKSIAMKKVAEKVPREVKSAITKAGWKDPESRKRRMAAIRASWNDPVKRANRINARWRKPK